MTKAEKKIVISTLLNEVEIITDIPVKADKLSKVIAEIYSAGYNSRELQRVTTIINVFINDFQNHIGDKNFLTLSKTGLITCIDWSLLPD